MKNLKVPLIPDSLYSTMTTSGLGSAQDQAAEPSNDIDPVSRLPTQDLLANQSDFDDEKMADILQRLADDAELHKLLSDEKMRCEIHKSNYEKIKAEYLRFEYCFMVQELLKKIEKLF